MAQNFDGGDFMIPESVASRQQLILNELLKLTDQGLIDAANLRKTTLFV